MLAKKKSVTLPEEKISVEDSMTLNADELKNFQEEIQRQIEGGNKIIDIGKAVRNARYLAKIDEAIEDRNAGRGISMTFEELERFINAERRI